jgi:hypothetical protein
MGVGDVSAPSDATTTLQVTADAFVSSPRCENPNTPR